MLEAGAAQAVVGGIVAFAAVAGWALFRWASGGRDPVYLDDESILLPAPPPGMTAATATVVDGGATRTALFAGLLDLASRDEIAFRDEGPGPAGRAVGIEIHGGPSNDPQVLLNRRRPIGEAEAWLLTFLKEYALQGASETAPDVHSAEGMETMLRFMGFTAGIAGDSPGGSLAGGMLTGTPSVEALVAAAEARTGHPMTPQQRASMERLAPFLGMLADPADVAADPQAWAERVAAESGSGVRPTADEVARLGAWAQHAAAGQRGQATGQASTGEAETGETYISAALARRFQTPIGFGTFLETYARRHGWMKGLSVVARLKWRALAVVEGVLGLVVAALGGRDTSLLTGVGFGIAGGALATWFIAPAMAARTPAGASMKAQLAAYRRTIKSTLATAPSVEDAVTSAGLAWLETPDQLIVWGVALGLAPDIEAILDRGPADTPGGVPTGHRFIPAWWRGSHGGTTAAGAMFAGIEAIGSVHPEPSRA